MNACADIPVRFFQRLPGELRAVDKETAARYLPMSRPGGECHSLPTVTVKAYLNMVESFARRNWDRLLGVIREIYPEFVGAITRFDIISEKHGSDYHPARIAVGTRDSVHSFVVNVAVTERGRSRLANELSVLRRLRRDHPSHSFLPEAYFLDEDRATNERKGSIPVAMFLGEWLDGYHEFHLVADPQAGNPVLSLWDTDRGTTCLTTEEAREIYRQAAFVLTHYYDPVSFHEIFPWHHAAGDFVVLRSGEKLDVKLITARQYAPRIEFSENSRENQAYSLLAFLANLTIRMRLDRADGVGETLWAGDHCLEASIRGFADAMREKVATGRCSATLWSAFLRVARDTPPDGLAEIFASVTESYAQDAPDVPVIRNHLVDHIVGAYRGMRNLLTGEGCSEIG